MNKFQSDLYYKPNPTVYRFFERESYADDFVRGRMRIGTFSSIIELSDNVRGDKGEGSIEYYSGAISGRSEDSKVRYIASQSGISAENIGNLTIVNCSSRRFQDAYLMSLTHTYRPEDMQYFGKYCVKIVNSTTLMRLIADALPIEEGVLLYNRVQYRERLYSGVEVLCTHPALIKPPTPEYLRQNETRAVWIPNHPHTLSPVFININSASSFCERIS